MLFLAGVLTSLALAGRPPGFGHGHGGSGPTAETTTAIETTTVTVTTTTASAPTKLLVLCHPTGSREHPYVKLSVPTNAVWTRVKHGDLLPGPSGNCSTSVSTKSSPGNGHKPSH